MDKRQIIVAIRQINVNAEVAFLEQFDAADLQEYLHRLEGAANRSSGVKAWTRPHRREYSRAS
ncbi:MAG TPA: hypothetical protein VGB55_02530 [Tepidisphaeraceae bacterium]|jgi:hypothetical protein